MRTRASTWALVLIGACGGARATETRAPGPVSATTRGREVSPPAPVEVEQTSADGQEKVVTAEPRASAEVERRHGKVVTVSPPTPPRDDYDVWGGVTGSPVGEDYGVGGPGCRHGAEPPPPSRVRHGRRPVVRLRTLAAGGALTREVATPIFRARTEDIGDCMLGPMEERARLAGQLRLRLEIAAGGGVLAAAADGLEAVAGCVAAAARGWRFPPADEGATVTAEFVLDTEAAPPERARPIRCRP